MVHVIPLCQRVLSRQRLPAKNRWLFSKPLTLSMTQTSETRRLVYLFAKTCFRSFQASYSLGVLIRRPGSFSASSFLNFAINCTFKNPARPLMDLHISFCLRLIQNIHGLFLGSKESGLFTFMFAPLLLLLALCARCCVALKMAFARLPEQRFALAVCGFGIGVGKF